MKSIKVSNTNFTGANFQKSDLSNSELFRTKSNFRKANLSYAKMIKTDFYKSRIRETVLQNTYFQDTNLLSAKFYKSDTSSVNYKNCILPSGEHLK